jgi:hypothetical protein
MNAELLLEIRYRLVGSRADVAWSPSRRATYLLRDDAAPISMDRRVSPYAEESPDDTWLVAGCILDGEAARNIWMGWGAPSMPHHGSEDWISLGYDVCDETLTSGLTNCGYAREYTLTYKNEWADRINEWHLIRTVDDAADFARFSDIRVPEHAPFFVFHLYRVVSVLK